MRGLFSQIEHCRYISLKYNPIEAFHTNKLHLDYLSSQMKTFQYSHPLSVRFSVKVFGFGPISISSDLDFVVIVEC